MERICGTCQQARACGRPGELVCTCEEYRRFTTANQRCPRPRQWWRPRADLEDTGQERLEGGELSAAAGARVANP